MLARWFLGVTALLALAPAAEAQLRVRLAGGVTLSSVLVTDSIIERIAVQPGTAPSFQATLDGTLDSVYRVGVSVAFASSTLRSTTSTGVTDIVTLTVWEPALRLGRGFGPVDAGVRAGLQVYRPARQLGIFRDGGRVTPSIGADVTLAGPRIAGAILGIGADWTVSRFSTTTLALSGFSGEQTVHRLGLRLTVAGGPGAH